jgi:hypothetical protein
VNISKFKSMAILEFKMPLSMQDVNLFLRELMYTSTAGEEVFNLCWSAKAERIKGTLFCPTNLSILGSLVPPEGSLMMLAPSIRPFSAVTT